MYVRKVGHDYGFDTNPKIKNKQECKRKQKRALAIHIGKPCELALLSAFAPSLVCCSHRGGSSIHVTVFTALPCVLFYAEAASPACRDWRLATPELSKP